MGKEEEEIDYQQTFLGYFSMEGICVWEVHLNPSSRNGKSKPGTGRRLP
jgi:hypothetical protein